MTMVGDHGGHKNICLANRVAVAVLRAVNVAVLDVTVDVLRAVGAAAIGR